MFYFNFFNKDTLWDVFCRFYDIKRQFAEPLVMQAAEQYDPVLYFLENTNLALDCISVEDVFLHCKHITTSKDDLASFSQYGLLSLKGSLSKDTSLRRFLLENEIEIDMEQMTFSFKGKTIYLHDYIPNHTA